MSYVYFCFSAPMREEANHIQKVLESHGFRIWVREPQLVFDDPHYGRILKSALRGTMAVVVVRESAQASFGENFTADLDSARSFLKPVVPISSRKNLQGLLKVLGKLLPKDETFTPLPSFPAEFLEQARANASNEVQVTPVQRDVTSPLAVVAALGALLLSVVALIVVIGQRM